MTHPRSDRRIAAAQERLHHLAGLARKTDAAERKILEAAEARRASVVSDLAKLKPRVDLDPTAAERYQALVAERGQLELVIASAHQAIAP